MRRVLLLAGAHPQLIAIQHNPPSIPLHPCHSLRIGVGHSHGTAAGSLGVAVGDGSAAVAGIGSGGGDGSSQQLAACGVGEVTGAAVSISWCSKCMPERGIALGNIINLRTAIAAALAHCSLLWHSAMASAAAVAMEPRPAAMAVASAVASAAHSGAGLEEKA